MMLKTIIIAVFGLYLFQCGTGDTTTSHRNANILIGKWEGKDDEGKIGVYLTIDKEKVIIQYLGEMPATNQHQYKLYETNNAIELKIDGIEEHFIVKFGQSGQMYLDLNDNDRRKPAVSVLAMMTFTRIDLVK
ncbi:MAG: hypothetical protein ABJB40_12790 [Acidobacteriota bacterium]